MPTDHSSALALSATIVLTVLASAAAAQQGGADQSSPPPPPTWVDADGKVKPEIRAARSAHGRTGGQASKGR